MSRGTVSGNGIVTDGLVLALDAANPKSYVSGSTAWGDLSNNVFNATLTNGPGYSSASLGNIVFDGIDDRATISSGPIETTGIRLGVITSPWMVNVWIRTSVAGSNSLATFPVLTNQSGGPVYSVMGIGSGGVMRFDRYDTSWKFVTGSIAVNDNRWHLLSWVNLGNNTMDLYVDGVLDKNVTSSYVTNNPVNAIAYSYSNQHLNCSIAFISINRATRLYTSTDVLQNYNATKTRFGL